jgi:hypothetical protein
MIKKYFILTFSLSIHLINLGFIEASGASSVREAQQLEATISCEEVSCFTACASFETSKLKLEAISSAAQDINCYRAIYKDSGWQNSWFSGSNVSPFSDKKNTPEGIRFILEDMGCDPIFESQHERIQEKDAEIFREKEREGFYKTPLSFPNYVIRDKETGEIVGKFIFMDVKKGRVENGIYILSNFRNKKFSSEILTGIITHVINPALGKRFVFASKTYPEFKGIYAMVSPWYNYPSLKAYCNVGCVTRWEGYAPILFYPPAEEIHLASSDEGLHLFLDLIKELYMFNEYLGKIDPSSCGDRESREFFGWIKRNGNDDFKESICCILDGLSVIKEQYTARFAKESLDILDEERSQSEENEESQGEGPSSFKRHRRENS